MTLDKSNDFWLFEYFPAEKPRIVRINWAKEFLSAIVWLIRFIGLIFFLTLMIIIISILILLDWIFDDNYSYRLRDYFVRYN